MVCPEDITFDESSISPPPPVEVTEQDRTSSVVALKMLPIVTVAAMVEFPSVIEAAVATPAAELPNAVVLKVRIQTTVEPESRNLNVPKPTVEGASIRSTTESASKLRTLAGCETAMAASY